MTSASHLFFRPAKAGDLGAVEALERDCFSVDAQSRRSLSHLIGQANADVLLAESIEGLRGSVIVLYRRGALVARVYSIAVAARARGQGVGTALLGAAQDVAVGRGCRTLRAEARVSNTGSLALFERAGYRRGASLPAYYPDGEDGVRLEKPLPE
ncbi:GNAT family N-acetyltransferase [Salinisphaera aquimarina]|uniref:GNAT family N-acetyltransferase n=1 Tax=Salinisphaera aquimarina TaxID=2094031 RepID=A0ABV7ETR4_9GAMM